ncbi:type I restriction endonuclease subunit R [Atopobium fossor]|uniref:type I restriction endonuclease subunit R n=1 Tax=Atopobium fossor TaxID=39487 RepID=UPI000429B07C|nr:HsdR family type I site-specific deoxyribonuclease [Atopobium fossor]
MVFESEAAFENAVIESLIQHGWSSEILKNPTKQDLLDNWADILYRNNIDIDRLNGQPLTASEMNQVIEQINVLRTPSQLNEFINGKSVSIKRDNPADKLHLGKIVSLQIYNRNEVAGGKSIYQIAQQPIFDTPIKEVHNRRGDLLLLICGMPVIHIELKGSNVPISQAVTQIKKYMHEGVYHGIYSLVQVFFAMNPNETKYFANPGSEDAFKPEFQFHWGDFYNNPINDWKEITSTILSIPMAHQLIGFYIIADSSDGVLKVMRSYQIKAVEKITDRVITQRWGEKNQRGGYIWHTTGSGKTMTSFKAAELIANSHAADKVIFLMDRIELSTQSLRQYNDFTSLNEEVQGTNNTYDLRNKLRSTDPSNTLIVTSIQKMSNIHLDANGITDEEIAILNKKRMVVIVDECHRSTFGDEMAIIKRTFPFALFFGFTGTPIQGENEKNKSQTSDIFGNELHRYSIADGIRDKNVLGFDPYMICVYKDKDIRREVALHQAKASSVKEALSDLNKKKIYLHFMNKNVVPEAGYRDASGEYHKGIEDYIPKSQFDNDDYRSAVVKDIAESFETHSLNHRYHAIFATSSIHEAIAYYRLFKQLAPEIVTTALFDPNIDNNEGAIEKSDGLAELIKDYNQRFDREYTAAKFQDMKKDISSRLAHKSPYKGIEKDKSQQIDILIVVDQMLTGFDSKWVNTLYLDKVLKYEGLIQAFSRTNRLFRSDEKPYGIIRYYRLPHTMKRNVKDAIKLYSGDVPFGLFVDKLHVNLKKIDSLFLEIESLFNSNGVENFASLPESYESRAKFSQLFRDLFQTVAAAKLQGFVWRDDFHYEINIETETNDDSDTEVIELSIDERAYETLIQRYKELQSNEATGSDSSSSYASYELDPYITEYDLVRIDADYMNHNFKKWIKAKNDDKVSVERVQQVLQQLHRSYASLSQELQEIANLVIHDIDAGDLEVESDKDFMTYITQYQAKAFEDEVTKIVDNFGLDEQLFRSIIATNVTEANLNEYERFDKLKASVDKGKAANYIESVDGETLKGFRLNARINKLLKSILLEWNK